MDDILIRAPRSGDGEGLARVWINNGAYYADLDPELFRVPDADGLAQWLEERVLSASSEDRLYLVAETDGQVVGFIYAVIERPMQDADTQVMCDLDRVRLRVNALGVHSTYWRQGIGARLMHAAEEWARGRGAVVALLDTYINSPVSVPFYEMGMGYSRASLHFRKKLV